MSEEACEEVGPGCFLFGKQQLAEGEERERESSKRQREKEHHGKSAEIGELYFLTQRAQHNTERATRDTDRRSRHGSRVAWIVFIPGPSAFRCELEVD